MIKSAEPLCYECVLERTEAFRRFLILEVVDNEFRISFIIEKSYSKQPVQALVSHL